MPHRMPESKESFGFSCRVPPVNAHFHSVHVRAIRFVSRRRHVLHHPVQGLVAYKLARADASIDTAPQAHDKLPGRSLVAATGRRAQAVPCRAHLARASTGRRPTHAERNSSCPADWHAVEPSARGPGPGLGNELLALPASLAARRQMVAH